MTLAFFVLSLFFSSCGIGGVQAVIFCTRPANETSIRQKLFPPESPVNGSSRYVYPYGTRIKLMVFPLGLWELSEQTDIASLLFYVKIRWKDPSKRWNKLTSRECLMISTDTPVWKPMIKFVDDRSMLINSRVIYQPEVMHLLSDGSFFYANIFQVRQIVSFDTVQFPFDQVRLEVMCNIDNVYSADLDYVPVGPSSNNRSLQLTPDWELVSNECRKDNTNATQCEIVVSRNAQFYIVNFCVPTLATTTLAVFGIHSAVQVNSRSSKYQMGLMALISLSTVSFSFVGSLPRSGHVSRLHVFYFGMVGAIFSSCLISWTILSLEKSKKLRSKRDRTAVKIRRGGRDSNSSDNKTKNENQRNNNIQGGVGSLVEQHRCFWSSSDNSHSHHDPSNNDLLTLYNGGLVVSSSTRFSNIPEGTATAATSGRPTPTPTPIQTTRETPVQQRRRATTSAALMFNNRNTDSSSIRSATTTTPVTVGDSAGVRLGAGSVGGGVTAVGRSFKRRRLTAVFRNVYQSCRSIDFLRALDTASVIVHLIALTNLTLWFMSAPQAPQHQEKQSS